MSGRGAAPKDASWHETGLAAQRPAADARTAAQLVSPHNPWVWCAFLRPELAGWTCGDHPSLARCGRSCGVAVS